MRIAIDIQGLQNRGNSLRGIGRYIESFITSLFRNCPDNEYILVANSKLPDIQSKFIKFINDNDYKIVYLRWYSPEFSEKNIDINSNEYMILEELHTYAFSRLNSDLILCTSFFDGFNDDCIVTFSSGYNLPPLFTIFYDLIPLINPKEYLDCNLPFKEFYLNRIDRITDFNGFLSISNSSTKEANSILNIDRSSIFNISSGCNSKVFNLDNNNSTDIHTIDSSLVKNGFILYVGAADPRKNLIRLLEAYSLIDERLQKEYRLVLVGSFTEKERKKINSKLNELSISSGQIRLLGYVSDFELKALYQKCALFIFPSLHEGFGLPVLEAMSSGAVVIASNISSIKEILVYDKFLFDPSEVFLIAKKISIFLTDKKLRQESLDNSIEQVKKFTWSKTSYLANEAFDKFLSTYSNSFTHIKDWKVVSDNRTIKFNRLVSQLKSYIFSSSFLKANDNFFEDISASIDLIELETDIYDRLMNKAQENNLRWHVEGPFDSNYSLAILNRNFALALSKEVFSFSLNNTEGPGDYIPNIAFLKKLDSFYKLFITSRDSGNLDICSRNLYPPRVEDMHSRINLIHAYGWEETQLPIDWIDDFNINLQGITVMSNLVKKILIDNGVYIPISISPLGINHIDDTFDKYELTVDLKSFVFLHISSCFPRKGVEVLLNAYAKAFNSDDDVSLVIKTFTNPHNNLEDLLVKFKKNINYPHVVVVREEMEQSEVVALYKRSNCLVAPSYGEGFGLPIAEAMKLGIPVITTGWGGQMDFCNPDNSWLIDYSFEYSKTHFKLHYSLWAKPSLNDLVKKMKEVYFCPKDKLKCKILHAKQTFDENYKWENTVKQNIKFVEKISSFDSNIPTKIGWITTWNTRCGIASYSQHLIDKIPSVVSVFAPYVEQELGNEDINVHRTWKLNSKEEDFSNLKSCVKNEGITTLIIQFNYGFFDFSKFSDFILELKKENINIIIFFHSTQDPIGQIDKSLAKIKHSLSVCDRLLVHSPSDMNRLKSMDLSHKACIFPHGILDFKPALNFNHSSFIHTLDNEYTWQLSSYGFLLPKKGFQELIRAIDYIRRKGLKVKLNLYTAIYNSDFIWLQKDLQRLIKLLDLDKTVIINSDYLSDDEILHNLSKSDLIVFPYQSSNESSSAAVRQALSSQKPVVVTPLSIFEDVASVTHSLPGTSASDIGNGIINLIENYDKIIGNYQLVQEWREQHYFSKLGKRIYGIAKSIEKNR